MWYVNKPTTPRCTGDQFSLYLQYYTGLVFCAQALLILGGFCFIFAESTVDHVRENWDEALASMTPEERADADLEETVDNLQLALNVSGGVALLLFFMSMSVMSKIVNLVTPVKAYTILLQATSIAQLPLGMGLIAAGVYVADTAASVDAPFAAFGIFVMGVLVLVLTLVGLAGTGIQSRGIVKVYMICTAVLSLLFLVTGIVSLVQADTVQQYVSDNWSSVRRVLPSSFSGKYDKEQFEKFVASNLLALGFMCLVVGLVLTAQWESARRLRVALKIESDLEVREDFEAGEDSVYSAPGSVQLLWKQRWTHGSKSSRRLIMCTCCCASTCVVVILAVAVMGLYFSTSCASFGEYRDTKVYDSAMLTSSALLSASSTFVRGVTSITVADTAALNATFSIEKGAFREAYADKTFPELGSGGGGVSWSNSSSLAAAPKPATQIAGFDISCQFANLDIQLPPAQHYGGNTLQQSQVGADLVLVTDSGLASIEVDWSSTALASRPRIRRLRTQSNSGPTDITAVLIGAEGFQASSTTGDMTLEQVDAACDPSLLGAADAGVQLTTEKGALVLFDSNFQNCDVVLSSVQSVSEVRGSSVHNSNGGGLLSIAGTKGVITVLDSSADDMDLRGDEGSVTVQRADVAESIKVATTSGRVLLTGIKASTRAVVQVETSSGNINIDLLEFRGIVSVVSGGRVTCSGAGFDGTQACPSQQSNGLTIVEEATANCAENNDCAYQGELIVTSDSGDVAISIASWPRS